MTKQQILKFSAFAGLNERIARYIKALAHLSIKEHGFFSIVLSGGNTPKGLYQRLSRMEMPWENVFVFFGDERCVPPDHPMSNFKMAEEALLSSIQIPRENVHRIRGEEPPEQEARGYGALMFEKLKKGDAPLCIDLVLLGLGSDGHTASIFPGDLHPLESKDFFLPAIRTGDTFGRITMTLSAINEAFRTIFLVSGEDKAEIARDVIASQRTTEGSSGALYPASMVRPTTGKVIWAFDAKAGALI